jgi:hypothetical protein
MASTVFTRSWLKFSDMSFFTMCAVLCTQTRAVQSVQKSSDSDSSIFKTPTPTPQFLKLRLRLLDF